MAEKRNQATPAASSTSPRLMTLDRERRTMGRMSPSGPPASRNSRPSSPGSATWNVGERSAAVSPATSTAGMKTGMYPPLSRMASPLAADAHHRQQQARLRPVEPEGAHEQPERHGEERDAQLVHEVDALLDEPLCAEAQDQRQQDEGSIAQLDGQEVAEATAREQAHHHPEDAGDQQHGVRPGTRLRPLRADRARHSRDQARHVLGSPGLGFSHG